MTLTRPSAPISRSTASMTAVAGQVPVKRNRFIQLSGGTRKVNRELEGKVFQIEKSFRMAKSDLQARPVYHRKRDSLEAHLTIVLAMAVSRWIEHQTGWSIRRLVKTARRYRTIQIQAGPHTVTAADPIPDDLRAALNEINNTSVAH
jgi:hypothetical protein